MPKYCDNHNTVGDIFPNVNDMKNDNFTYQKFRQINFRNMFACKQTFISSYANTD